MKYKLFAYVLDLETMEAKETERLIETSLSHEEIFSEVHEAIRHVAKGREI
jgi:hypothetical protein